MSSRAATIRGLTRSPTAGVLSEINEAFTPRSLPNLAAWFDALDTSTMLSGDGTTITDGGAVALWSDKSGNSGVNCLALPGVTGNYASVPDSAEISITGDLDLRANVALNDWTPTGFNSIISKIPAASGQWSYEFGVVQTTGLLQLAWSPNGTSGAVIVKASTAAPTVADLASLWVRVTLDVDNGAAGNDVKFYTSADGSTWTQLGNTVTTAGTTSIFDGTAAISIGSNSGGAANFLAGRVYRAIVKDGIGGTTVLDIDFSTAPKKLANGDTFTCATGQAVTLNSSGATGARIAGERDLYNGTLASRPVYLAHSGTKYGYFNALVANYISCPDSNDLDITGDIALVCDAASVSWVDATSPRTVIGKLVTNTGGGYELAIDNATNRVRLYWSDGSSLLYAEANAALVATNNVKLAIAGVLDVDDGAGNRVARFYTSPDYVTWTQLGTTITTAGTTSIGANTSPVSVGRSQYGVGANPWNGRIYRAQIYSGIPATFGGSGGTLKADFNPSLYTSGTTFTASTGEVWTINGGAHIVTRTGLYFDGSNDYLKTAAFSLSQPETVYWTGSQVSWTANDGIYDGNSTSEAMSLYQRTSSPNIDLYGGGAGTAINGGLALATAATVSSVFNNTSSSLRVNRGTATGSGQAIGNQAANGFIVGANRLLGAPANVVTQEVAIYAAAHPTATQDRMALYAGRKHGFSV